MSYSVMEQYWIWLSSVHGISVKHFCHLISKYGDARTVWDNVNDSGMAFLGTSTRNNLREAHNELYFIRIFSELERLGIRAITRLSDDYPARLTTIYDPPPTLYVRGEADLSHEKMFSVVGSRRATRDGLRAAREISATLANEDVTVVSGLAYGIDAAAHEGALEGHGRTIAVLGSGVDVIYPTQNAFLGERILDSGGAILSEYPPGMPPLKGHFPARNRIISGLSQGLLLVEGAKGSGAMITVNFAFEQNRDVFAVPGSIYSPLSCMPNQMILEGATPTLSGWDILENYRWASRPTKTQQKERMPDLESEELPFYEALLKQELSFDELMAVDKIPAAKLNFLLTRLVLRGIIVKAPGGIYRAYK